MRRHVAYVCADPGVPVFGTKGCSIHVQEVIRALLRRGDHVHLFTPRLGGHRPDDLQSVHVHRLPCPDEPETAAREQALIGANVALRIQLERIPRIDLVYERHALFSYAGMEYARDHRCLGILEVNSPLIEEQETYRELVDRDGAVDAARRAIAAARKVAAVSDAVADTVRMLVPGQDRVQIVGNGVDPDRFHPEVPPRRVFDEQDFVVGFVGVPKPWHDLTTLCRAVLRVRRHDRSVKLLIVGKRPGGSPRTRETHQLCKRLGDAVHVTGPVEHAEVPSLLAGIDVAAAPYPNLPGFYFSPLKVLEYMAAGRAIVAAKIGEIPQLIQDGRAGLLVQPGDEVGLADALRRLRDDPEARAAMGIRARRRVLSNYTWEQVVSRTLEQPIASSTAVSQGVA